jgi:tetratricopeptide (TPR) repeat protein
MNYTKYLFILLIGGALCSPFSVFAQKKKNKKIIVLSESDSLRLDAIFIDATNEFLNENYNEAIKDYEKVKDGYPTDGAVYHQIAKCYGGLSSTQKAIQYEEIAVELDTKNKFYYLYLADLYQEIKAWNEMATCYEAMLKNTTGSEEFYYDLGHLYAYFFQLSKRQYLYTKSDPDNNYLTQKIPKKERKRMDELVENSLVAYDTYDEFFGINDELIKDKQEILLDAGRLDQAVTEGDRLVEKYPGNTRYILENASLYSGVGQYQNAIDYLLLKQKHDSNYRITLALVQSYEKLDQTEKVNSMISSLISNKDVPFEEKMEILVELIKTSSQKESMDYILEFSQDLVKIYPDNNETKFLLADVYFFMGSMDSSREQYLLALQESPDNRYAWQQVLGIDLKNNDYQALKKDALLATATHTEESMFHYWLATAYAHDYEYKKAITSLLKANEWTQKNELQIRIQAELGENYYRLHEYEKSDIAYDQALLYSPNNAFVLNNYSYYLSLRKVHLNKAKSMSKRLIMLYPNEPAYLDTYGWVLYQMKQYKEASLYIGKAASKTESVAIFEHYGDVLFRLKKEDEALVWWKKAKSAGSKSLLLDRKIEDKQLYED